LEAKGRAWGRTCTNSEQKKPETLSQQEITTPRFFCTETWFTKPKKGGEREDEQKKQENKRGTKQARMKKKKKGS
jgi:hypothetical protein